MGDFLEPPPKRLKQTSITDCFKKPELNPSVELEDRELIQESSVKTKIENMSVPSISSGASDKSSNTDCKIDIEESETSDLGLSVTEDLIDDMVESQPKSRSQEWIAKQTSRYSQLKKESKASVESDEEEESGDLSLGIPIEQLNRRPGCTYSLPPLQSSEKHTVLFNLSSDFHSPPEPWPSDYIDIWDENHVRMACSPQNTYPVGGHAQQRSLEERWKLITRQLRNGFLSSKDLQDCILSYNQRYEKTWDFDGLHEFFNNLRKEESDAIFSRVLPRMAQLALRLPELCTKPIPLLKKDMSHSITLSQQQVACLLANAFFCTFPRRNASGYLPLPSINFANLFKKAKQKGNRVSEKLMCLFHYFHRVTKRASNGAVTFTRQSLNRFPVWEMSKNLLQKCHVASSGTIEVEGTGMLQVDFANKRVGGGVLGWGCVQEEIRFIICPELIISRLFTEKLENNECLVMTGCEQFCSYEGYADSFAFTGKYVDLTPTDAWGRRFTQVVAMDATSYRSPKVQYLLIHMKREIDKAYCGFYSDEPAESRTAVATGNWGCGVFRGDPRFKALLQLMAAAEAGRDLVYFTFGNKSLCKHINRMHSFLTENEVTVGSLWEILLNFKDHGNKDVLYQFIYDSVKENRLNDNNTTTKDVMIPSTSSR